MAVNASQNDEQLDDNDEEDEHMRKEKRLKFSSKIFSDLESHSIVKFSSTQKDDESSPIPALENRGKMAQFLSNQK